VGGARQQRQTAVAFVYRTQAERWLEFLVREDVTRIDATLDSRFAYSQILASSAGEQGILDVLSVTRAGRLAITELKAVEHPVFRLQAAKYWPRVRAICNEAISRVTAISPALR
jgi:hypothetical protein